MQKEDVEILNAFQHEGFNLVEIDQNESKGGVTIDQLANQY